VHLLDGFAELLGVYTGIVFCCARVANAEAAAAAANRSANSRRLIR
jgi:hypothetical protein